MNPTPVNGALLLVGSALVVALVGMLPLGTVRVTAEPACSHPGSGASLDPFGLPILVCDRGEGTLDPRLELLAGRPLDLNRAGLADLVSLPRVGPGLARRILDDREKNGALPDVDALARVKGIGPRTLERLRPLVTVAPTR